MYFHNIKAPPNRPGQPRNGSCMHTDDLKVRKTPSFVAPFFNAKTDQFTKPGSGTNIGKVVWKKSTVFLSTGPRVRLRKVSRRRRL
jgi:hypothetical protein